jgi:hypothetical protein
MTKTANKGACLAILQRGLQRGGLLGEMVFRDSELRKKETFRGPANKWTRYRDPEFQALLSKHKITPDTRIAIAERGPDVFVVIKA